MRFYEELREVSIFQFYKIYEHGWKLANDGLIHVDGKEGCGVFSN